MFDSLKSPKSTKAIAQQIAYQGTAQLATRYHGKLALLPAQLRQVSRASS